MMFRILSLSTLLIALLPLQALARNYHVEAIIFSNTPEADGAPIIWDEKSPRNIRSRNKLDTLYLNAEDEEELRREAALQEIRSGEPDENESDQEEQPVLTVVTEEIEALAELRDSLEVSSQHEVLKALSWEQSEAGYDESPLIPILTSHVKGVVRVYAPNLLFTEINLVYVPDQVLEESLEIEAEEHSGLPQATITAGSINHSIRDPYTIQAVPETAPARHYLEEQRKLKLKEIHYFDHPRYGIILSVIPLEDPE